MYGCTKRSVFQCVLNNSKWKENINKQLNKNTFILTLTPHPYPSKTRKKRKEKGKCNYMHHSRTPSLICSILIRLLLIICVISTYTRVNSMCPRNIINITHKPCFGGHWPQRILKSHDILSLITCLRQIGCKLCVVYWGNYWKKKKMYPKKIYEIIKDIDDVVFLITNDFQR